MKRFLLFPLLCSVLHAAPRPQAKGPNGTSYIKNEIKVLLRDECACRISLDGEKKAKAFDADVLKAIHPSIQKVEARQTCAKRWLQAQPLPGHLKKPDQGIASIARRLTLVLKPGEDAAAVLAAVRAHPDVKCASLNLLLPVSAVPNDTRYSEMWAPPQTKLEEAWDLPQRADINVAVVDSGVDTSHPEFAGRIIFSNGYADFNYGDDPADRRNKWDHGTHVAGIIGARRNNGVGVAGYSERIRLMVMNCASWSDGEYKIGNADDAIEDAVAIGAHYINCSFEFSGGPFGSWDPIGPESGIRGAVIEAVNNGVQVVHSAGNDKEDMTGSVQTEGGWVINVSATAQPPPGFPENFDYYYSNWGGIDVAAPGSNILSTLPTGGAPGTDYGFKSGTSMAAPQVTGALALIRSLNPTHLHWTDTRKIMERCARTSAVFPVPDPYYGYGRLRLPKAMLEPVSFASAFVVAEKFSGAAENGNYGNPYGRISTALAAIPDGGTLVLNSYGPETSSQNKFAPQTITKPCTLTALPDHAVVIGSATSIAP
jgi:subtilisin family serine protease